MGKDRVSEWRGEEELEGSTKIEWRVHGRVCKCEGVYLVVLNLHQDMLVV